MVQVVSLQKYRYSFVHAQLFTNIVRTSALPETPGVEIGKLKILSELKSVGCNSWLISTNIPLHVQFKEENIHPIFLGSNASSKYSFRPCYLVNTKTFS